MAITHRIVSIEHGDRGVLFDACGVEIPPATWADLDSGEVELIDLHSRKRSVYKYAAPLRFDRAPGTGKLPEFPTSPVTLDTLRMKLDAVLGLMERLELARSEKLDRILFLLEQQQQPTGGYLLTGTSGEVIAKAEAELRARTKPTKCPCGRPDCLERVLNGTAQIKTDASPSTAELISEMWRHAPRKEADPEKLTFCPPFPMHERTLPDQPGPPEPEPRTNRGYEFL